MRTPVIVLNMKTYAESMLDTAVELAKISEKVSEESGVEVIVCPQFCDIHPIAQAVKIPVFAQHIDPINPGSHTGHVLAESVRKAGVVGTLINHSERRLDLEVISKTIEKAKSTGLETICCAPDKEEAVKIVEFNPVAIAFEDPVLIGSGKPISQVSPDAVKEFADTMKETNPSIIPLCGAVISTGEDVKAALELGTKGVLLASGVVKAKNQKTALEDLVRLI